MVKLTWRIWLLIILIVIAAIVIMNPKSFIGNVEIKSIVPNSSAAQAGISVGEIIKTVNGQEIKSIEDYGSAISALSFEETELEIKTENKTFTYKSAALDFSLSDKIITSVSGKAKESGLEEGMIVKEINSLSLDDYTFEEIKAKVEPRVKVTIVTEKNEYTFLATKEIGITVSAISGTRIKTGLDLQGGSRALVKPERELTQQEMLSLLETVRYRLNVYGLTDVNVREVSDMQGTSYLLVELAGATPTELQELIAKQGKFEAKIANDTVFIGGHNDITFVCRNDASCARIEQCVSSPDGTQASCRFQFEVHLSEAAAQRHADMTSRLSENFSEGQRSYLNETLDLYLDDKLVDSLLISSELKGKVTTSIAVSGSGIGKTKLDAYEDAESSMKKLQTILITGSLPFKLEIVKLDSISPALGKEFTRNVLIVAIAVFITVCIVIYIRYRKLSLFIPVIITMFSEIFLTLFIAVAIRWNLDIASIAGIVAAIGTGVDDQIVMIDESKISKQYSMKERIKRAFFIIMGAYATVVVSLLPLWWAGAGLLRGFAVTTLIGITIGVLITRPAFADILSMITKD